MGSTFVGYKDFGYWSDDGLLEALMYLVVKELKKQAIEEEWAVLWIQEWTFMYSTGFSGCIPIDLEERLSDYERIDLFLDILRAIIRNIHKNLDYLNHIELNNNMVGGKGSTWYEINNYVRKGLVRNAHMTIDLIKGKLKTNSSSPLTYLKGK